MKYKFINLSNGIRAIRDYDLNLRDVRFLRIQSTACEQKRWEFIINSLSPDFLLLSEMGFEIIVYDYGANKEIPRSIWQGLEWVKFVLNARWHDVLYRPIGRAVTMGPYFMYEYKRLNRKTKRMLDYYCKFRSGPLMIRSCTCPTKHDGNVGMFIDILFHSVFKKNGV